MVPFTKLYTPPADQLAILKARGMEVSDEAKAERCLARIGYYRLSAYWYPFRESVIGPNVGRGKPLIHVLDNFKHGTSFEQVFDFYVFDKGLRLLVMDALERIEVALRTQISSLLGERDRWAHRNPSELDGKFASDKSIRNPQLTKHQDWMNGQDKNFDRSGEEFAKHFKSKYQGYPPIWIATEVWDWGMISHFYAGMKNRDKDSVASLYGLVSGKEMVSWVRSLNDVRNICAHHSRLWNRGLKVTLKIPSKGDIPEIDHLIGDTLGTTRIYGVLVIMALMLRAIHPASQWHKRVVDHVAAVPKNNLIGPQTAGFPSRWASEAIWT